jgi:glycosyltransferase involved in cell wall biosynthesis
MTLVRLISPRHFEPWDFRNPDDPGIGGSETMHVELAWRLAALGHEVHSYVPRREDTPALHRGVHWHDVRDVDYAAPGVFILVRGLPLIRAFSPSTSQRIWCVFQDEDEYPETWERVQDSLGLVEKFIGLCTPHVNHLRENHPDIADRVVQSRNGIRLELLQSIISNEVSVKRQSHRLMYASSPDRGLRGLLTIWSLIRFCVPDAELHVCYGFDNLEKGEHASGKNHAQLTALRSALKQPGIVLRGRMGQPDLYRAWLQASVMCAPTNFRETGYITLMEAQACGVLPIVNPIWAAQENLCAGIGIEGDGEHSSITLRQYAMAAVHCLRHADEMHDIRLGMMIEARKRFAWQEVAQQYHTWLQEEKR